EGAIVLTDRDREVRGVGGDRAGAGHIEARQQGAGGRVLGGDLVGVRRPCHQGVSERDQRDHVSASSTVARWMSSTLSAVASTVPSIRTSARARTRASVASSYSMIS